jgi:hypothetical protein
MLYVATSVGSPSQTEVYAVDPATSGMTLLAGDNPSLPGASFGIAVVPASGYLRTRLNEAGPELLLDTVKGVEYVVFSTPSLAPPDWQPLSQFLGHGGLFRLSVTGEIGFLKYTAETP